MKDLLNTLLPELANCVIDGLGRDRLPRAKDPYALLFSQSGRASNRAEDDSVLKTFQLERVPCGKLQLVSYGLGQYDASSFVDGKGGIHNGILPLYLPSYIIHRDFLPNEKDGRFLARPARNSKLAAS